MANYYDSSNLWDDSPNKTDNYSTLGQILSIGDAFQNANTISDENVQNTILRAKNDLSSYEEYLKNLQGSNNLEDALKFKNNLHFLDLNLTPDLGYDHNPWTNIINSTTQGASAGSTIGPWGALGGAATGLHMSIGSELGGKRGANASIGSNLGALFLSPLTGGDPLTGGILGGIIGYNWDKSEDNERQKVYNELKAKEQEYRNYATNFANMNIQNNIDKNYRNMLAHMTAFGGYIGGNGGDWTDGLTFINTGGSHEQNPYGGVPMGIAPDGQPNLVEEGEVVWNDYVFSDRIKVPKKTVKDYKLKGKKDMTFAEAITNLQKSAEKRPNDPIEQQGLNTTLMKLAMEQEAIRQQQARKEENALMEEAAAYAADGGSIHIAKNKRGTFTAAATKHGMGVQEFARKVLANKEDYSPAMVKKANFARNAAKWHHAFGGHLFDDGGFWDKLFGKNNKPDVEWYRQQAINAGVPKDIADTWELDNFNDKYRDWQKRKFVENKLINSGRYLKNDIGDTYSEALYDSSNPNMFQRDENNKIKYDTTTTHKLSDIIDKHINDYDNEFNTSTIRTISAPETSRGITAAARNYIPVILQGATNLLSTALDKPNRTYSRSLRNTARTAGNMIPSVGFTPVGQTLAYRPLDRMFYANQLEANAAATRSAIAANANANRQAAINNFLAANYGTNIGLGNLYRQGEENSQAQRENIAKFNLARDQFNAQGMLDTAKQNSILGSKKADLLWDAVNRATAIDMQEDQLLQASRNAALTNLFDNWYAINRDRDSREMVGLLADAGTFGTLPQDWRYLYNTELFNR